MLTAAIPGDANGDGRVDINDLTIVLSHFGQTGQTWADCEFTGDGKVDMNDLTTVLSHFGQTAGTSAGGTLSAVPEPGAVALLAAAAVAALLAARRSGKWKQRRAASPAVAGAGHAAGPAVRSV